MGLVYARPAMGTRRPPATHDDRFAWACQHLGDSGLDPALSEDRRGAGARELDGCETVLPSWHWRYPRVGAGSNGDERARTSAG